MKFEMLKDKSSIIKVIGVGGGGGNAVNHMYRQGINGVDFVICNTDAQALESSPIPNKVQLGASLTEGMGAGSMPEVGKNAAIENIDDVKAMLGNNTKMLFITAGMGGGTGTGASPIIAQAAKELDILTVAIVTMPFSFEGKRRKIQAEEGLEELKKNVDSYLVISNDRLREIFGNLTMTSAFAKADDILTTAAKGIAEIITVTGNVNVDFKDVHTVMKGSGVAIMGSCASNDDNRALTAVEGALSSPLLKDNEIQGASYILLNISSGKKEVTMDEISIITDYTQKKAGLTADLIWGNCIDEALEDKLSVTIIATGFQTSEQREKDKRNIKKISLLTPESPLVKPVEPMLNFFIEQKEVEQADNEPVLKIKTGEPKQSNLFGDLFSTKPDRVEFPLKDKEDKVVYKLEEETPAGENKPQKPGFDFELKIAETDFTFETPIQKTEEKVEEQTFMAKEEAKADLDDDINDDLIEEQLKKAKERILKLRDLSMKLRTPNGLIELENEPAYKRKQMHLKQLDHSSESQVSRFTFSLREDGNTEIRPNNSFLHDNVD